MNRAAAICETRKPSTTRSKTSRSRAERVASNSGSKPTALVGAGFCRPNEVLLDVDSSVGEKSRPSRCTKSNRSADILAWMAARSASSMAARNASGRHGFWRKRHTLPSLMERTAASTVACPVRITRPVLGNSRATMDRNSLPRIPGMHSSDTTTSILRRRRMPNASSAEWACNTSGPSPRKRTHSPCVTCLSSSTTRIVVSDGHVRAASSEARAMVGFRWKRRRDEVCRNTKPSHSRQGARLPRRTL
jgi:hypothetical protein